LTLFQKWRSLVDLGLLYASKSGSVVVGILILPWYQQLLGPKAFGVVAMILSLQAFLLMLDLGTSTLVGRELSAKHDHSSNLVTLRAAELLLHIAYAALLVISISLNAIFRAPLEYLQVVLCIVFFWTLTVSNVGQSALLAKGRHALSGSIQVVGVLGRAAITVAMLKYINAELNTFLVAQTLSTVLQLISTTWFCRRVLNSSRVSLDFRMVSLCMRNLAKRGRPLVLFGIAGAAVLQLDKVIIPIFVSPVALTPYFLASALCLTPISVLAGPINQYFFPRIIGSITTGNMSDTLNSLRKLTLAIFVAVAIPSSVLWFGRDLIIGVWLNHQPIVTDVSRYVQILLPGVAFGALGYVPYNILIAHEDYRVHALLSTSMTIATLLATVVSAALGSVLSVCWVYASYHILSTVITWWRASYLIGPLVSNYAIQSAYFALKVLGVTLTIIVFIYYFFINIL
jgi:O-antigen/teichoic acid export membrane protein